MENISISFDYISNNCKTIGDIIELTEKYHQNALNYENEVFKQ